MAYWLLKTEPGTYSVQDLERDKKTAWDGVRNFQARNHLASMKVGDQCLIYHSGKERAVVGLAKVIKAAYPDPESEDPRWVNVDVRFVRTFENPVPLAEMKQKPTLAKMALLRQSRLSVCPMTAKEWQIVTRSG